jgi:transposase-like protein
MSYFPELKSLKDIFFDEQNCIDFLFENDILYKLQLCSHCNSSLNINYKDKIYRCINKECRKAVSIFKDSFFAKSHLKCSDIMLIGYYWLCGCSYSSIINMTGHSPNTVTNYMNFFRELVVSTLEDDDNIIGGPGIIVEIDESKFGKRKFHRGRITNNGVWIFGGIERTNEKKSFLKVVHDRTAETLHEIILRHIAPDSIVYTDLWRGYTGISELGVIHGTVNHSQNFVDPNTGVHTNTIEGYWNGLKLQIPSRNRSKKSITNCLLECIWRKRNKDNLWTSFLHALKTTGYFN